MRSVLLQNRNGWSLEYIIIDGASTDGTLNKIQECATEDCFVVSEPDSGIYDALNKGVKFATGDIVAVLHSDDFYIDAQVLNKVARVFNTRNADVVCTDAVFFSKNVQGRVRSIRTYGSSSFINRILCLGGMPAHPGMFIRREVYNSVGFYNPIYRICSDFDFYKRMRIGHKFDLSYQPFITVCMATGGVSTASISSKRQVVKEKILSLEDSNINTSFLFLYIRYAYLKICHLIEINKPKIKFWFE